MTYKLIDRAPRARRKTTPTKRLMEKRDRQGEKGEDRVILKDT
jgi:hypothetical protein